MSRLTIAALAAAASIAAIGMASAQTTPPASSPPATTSKTDKAPMPGANSFTEAQAKDRIEKAGFTQVTSLKKDDQGIWRASGMKGDKKVNVSLDFQGNVVAAQ
jgi:ABC-type nitrate/sulfonate/bicarbonate transport system substrate-binding protein